MADITSTSDPSKDLLSHRIEGKITAKEILDHLTNLYTSEKIRNNVIWDFTTAKGEDIAADEIMGIAQKMTRFDHLRKDGKTALVFSRHVGYGLGRMYQTHAENEGTSINYQIFLNRDEALKWLAS